MMKLSSRMTSVHVSLTERRDGRCQLRDHGGLPALSVAGVAVPLHVKVVYVAERSGDNLITAVSYTPSINSPCQE